MSELRVFNLPDVGEGLTEAEILRWHVRPGDAVAVNDMVVEIETAKASVELPCPYAGTVAELHVVEGAIVPVGSPIITIETAALPAVGGGERQAVLVGYGVRADVPVARRARRPADVVAGSNREGASTGRSRAKPLVRKLARDLGVDLAAISASGPNGEVTREDVLSASGGSAVAVAAPAHTPTPTTAPATVAGERIPVRGVQRAMADAMVQSAFTAPHVTEWVDVDMARAMEVLAKLREHPSSADVRISPMILVAAALVRAAVEQPIINSTCALPISVGPRLCRGVRLAPAGV